MLPIETVAYGSRPDQLVDLTVPAGGGPVPLVVLLHGGFWRAAYDRMHVRVVVDALNRAGYAVANLEYRRIGAGGGWPATFEDVAAGIDALAGALGGRVDLDAVAYVGHSAGGHLALWAALRDRLPVDAPGRLDVAPRVRGVVALAPVADLMAAERRGLSHGVVRELLGGDAAAVAGADPGKLGAPLARTVVVHGESDGVVPIEVARGYTDRFGVDLVALPGVGHFELIDPASPAWPAVLEAVRTVLA